MSEVTWNQFGEPVGIYKGREFYGGDCWSRMPAIFMTRVEQTGGRYSETEEEWELYGAHLPDEITVLTDVEIGCPDYQALLAQGIEIDDCRLCSMHFEGIDQSTVGTLDEQHAKVSLSEGLELPAGIHAETWYRDEDVSVAFVTLSGLNKRIVNHQSDMTYEIIAGSGLFRVGLGMRYVQAGDTVSIPAGTEYQDEGNLMMLATAETPFDPNDVEELQEWPAQ